MVMTQFNLSLAILSYSQTRTNYLSEYFVEGSEVSLVMEQDSGPVLLVKKGSRPLRGEPLRGSSECPRDDGVMGTLRGLAFSLAPRPKHTSSAPTPCRRSVGRGPPTPLTL